MKLSKILINKTAIAAAIFSTTVAGQALAQLEEVVVTAQKRTESMQDVPVAVSAVSGDEMLALGWDRPNDIATQVPNMQVSAPLGDVQPLFSIRGVSMVDYTPSQASPVGVYMDEAYLGSTYTHGMAMFDLERVEVLRGPQGTLYGKNTTGGAINLLTRTPDIGAETSGHFTVGAGNHGLQTADGAVEASLTDTLSGRIAVKYKEDDGYIKNNLGGDDLGQTNYTTYRGTLNFQPSEQLSAVLKITVGDSDGRSMAPRSEATLPFGRNVAFQPSSPGSHEGSFNKVGDTEVEMNTYNLKLSYDFESWTLVSVSSYYDADYFSATDVDGTAAALAGIDWGSESEAWAQDIRLVSNFDGPFTFIGGLYIGKEDIDTKILHDEFFADPAVGPTLSALSNALQAMNGGVPTPDSENLRVMAAALPSLGMADRRFDVEKESFAAYTHMTYDFTDDLRLTFGLRYTEDENTRDYINYSRLDQNGNILGSWLPGNLQEAAFIAAGVDAPFVTWGLAQQIGNPALEGLYLNNNDTSRPSGEVRTEKEEAVTGKISLDYTVNEDLMVYGGYSRGFRSGSFNNGLMYADQKNENGAYADPEYVDVYEFGFKSEFMDGTVRLNGAAFYYDYQDQQFVNQVGISAQLVNAGGVDIYGAELELIALPAEGLTVQAGLGYLDAEYSELVLPRLSTGVDPTDTINLKGNTPVSSPEFNFNFSSDYEFSVTDAISSRIHFDGSFTDDQWFSAYNDQDGHQDLRQDAYWLFNARWSVFDVEETYTLAVWGQNLADEEYDIYAINLQGGFGMNYFMEGKPKAYGLDFTYRF